MIPQSSVLQGVKKQKQSLHANESQHLPLDSAQLIKSVAITFLFAYF